MKIKVKDLKHGQVFWNDPKMMEENRKVSFGDGRSDVFPPDDPERDVWVQELQLGELSIKRVPGNNILLKLDGKRILTRDEEDELFHFLLQRQNNHTA